MRAAGADLARAAVLQGLPKSIVKASRGSVPLEQVFAEVAGGFASVVDTTVNVDALVDDVRKGLGTKRRAELDAKRAEIRCVTTRALNQLPLDGASDSEWRRIVRSSSSLTGSLF